MLKRTSFVVVHSSVARTLASPRWGEVHTPSTGQKPGEQGSKTQGESFLETHRTVHGCCRDARREVLGKDTHHANFGGKNHAQTSAADVADRAFRPARGKRRGHHQSPTDVRADC